MATSYPIRLPNKLSISPTEFTPPSNEWFEGTWYIVHTSLPLWRGKRNVSVTYTRLPAKQGREEKIDDLVSYQAVGSTKVKTVHGVDTPTRGQPGAWDWRGKGMLKITTSHWEILGHGELADGSKWAVTYFAKTPFTPAGFDVYAGAKDGLPKETLEGILAAIVALKNHEMDNLAKVSYAVVMD